MRLSRIYTLVAIAILLVVFSLVFVFIGVATPSESFDEQSGFGKVFASSPEFEFESGSLVMSCGDFSFSVNFGFDKPFLSLMSDGSTLHINVILFALIIVAMMASCIIPEISLATSVVIGALGGITSIRMISAMNQQIESGTPSWDVAAGSFWFAAFIFTVLIINGMIGIGGKILRVVIFTETARMFATLIVSALLANAISLILSLLLYLFVGIGFCAGLIIVFILAAVFVAFCEVMDIAVL